MIAAGTRFGPYIIAAPIGAGGMGEVYKATDARLHRTVAVKVLPESVAADELKRRFEREAKTLAALSHPHICPILDVGSQDGVDFIVMEYLEGDTLQQRLNKGALPLDQAQRIGIQIADALAAAHRAGIVHRDLKPGNVMLTKAGAKLLDFGLAKAGATLAAGSHSALMTTPPDLTQDGVILGTFQYMAPEQLEGREADARTDVFAFGAMLYEMITGRKAFEGTSQASVIAAILDSQSPPMAELNPRVPAVLDHLVERCLRKDPDDRWQSIRDVAIELDSGVDLRAAIPRSNRDEPWRTREWLGWATAGAILLGALALTWTGARRDQPQSPITRLSVLPPERNTFLAGYSAPHLALSPDGRRLALVPTPVGGRALLWVRALDSLTNTPIAGTDGATFPFWSPDGRRLAFFADGKLKTIDPNGGPPSVVCDAPDARGGAWGANGVIVFTPQLAGPLYRVAADGGKPIAVTKLDPSRQEISHRLPSFLPDGRHYLFLVQSGTVDNSKVRVGGIDSEESRDLDIVGTDAIYAQGFLLFRRNESLMAQPFDLSTMSLAGAAVPLGDQVAFRNTVYGDGVFSVAEDGTLAYWNGGTLLTDLTWFSRAGKPQGTLRGGLSHASFSLSPDERTVAVESADDENQVRDLWMVDVASGIRSRFTSGSVSWGPMWSPDGTRVIFGSLRNGPSSLYEKSARGLGAEQLLLKGANFIGITDWSSDGRSILTADLTQFKLGVLVLDGDRTVKPLLKSEFVEGEGRWSPDQRWVAYTSNESGVWDVYVQPFPALDRKWRISPEGGSRPQWRADGKELYYVGPDQRLMAVPVIADSEFKAGVPTALFQLRTIPFPPTQPRQQYAVTEKGDRFLVNTFVEPPVPAPVTIILNWTAALKK